MCVQDALNIPRCTLGARSLGLLGARRRGYRSEPATRRIGQGVVYSPGGSRAGPFPAGRPEQRGDGLRVLLGLDLLPRGPVANAAGPLLARGIPNGALTRARERSGPTFEVSPTFRAPTIPFGVGGGTNPIRWLPRLVQKSFDRSPNLSTGCTP